MKKILLSFLTLTALGLNAQNVNIPDANFKAYLVGNPSINLNNDTEIQVGEASFVNSLDVNGLSISNLTGIEAFTNLTYLKCAFNQLTNIDLSANTALVNLWCGNNSLASLDLSVNTTLQTLDCRFNFLTNLDFSANTQLFSLHCENNALTILNIANGANTGFGVMNAISNPNLSCIQVDNVSWSTQNWTSIPPSASFNLNCTPCNVSIPDANFKTYLVGNIAINTNGNTEIECSEATAFTGAINCSNQSISDLTGIEAFTNLTRLWCYNNNLASLDVSNNTALTNLSCPQNSLTSLDITQNILLDSLNINNNQITSIDITNNTALTFFQAASNQLSNIDVTQNTMLLRLWLSTNSISSINVMNNINLETFVLGGNQITSLDLSSNGQLDYLDCGYNNLINLDLSGNLLLDYLKCNNNNLTNLNIANGNNTNFLAMEAIGNSNLTCIQVDDSAYSAINWTNIDATANFSENCGTTTSILNSLIDQSFINIYPNPTNGRVTFNSEVPIKSIVIYNLTGKIETTFNNTSIIDISNLSNGVYFAKVIAGVSKPVMQKLIKN